MPSARSYFKNCQPQDRSSIRFEGPQSSDVGQKDFTRRAVSGVKDLRPLGEIIKVAGWVIGRDLDQLDFPIAGVGECAFVDQTVDPVHIRNLSCVPGRKPHLALPILDVEPARRYRAPPTLG